MSMKMKGQTLVFEQVLLFSLSVVILMTSFALFMMYQNYYMSETSQDQISQVKEYILSSIIKLCEKDEFNSTVTLSIPRTIGNNFYRISLTNQGLNLTMVTGERLSDFSKLYGFNETFSFGGWVVSDIGKIVIYKKDMSVILDRGMPL